MVVDDVISIVYIQPVFSDIRGSAVSKIDNDSLLEYK